MHNYAIAAVVSFMGAGHSYCESRELGLQNMVVDLKREIILAMRKLFGHLLSHVNKPVPSKVITAPK